jgi:hypothetical protein
LSLSTSSLLGLPLLSLLQPIHHQRLARFTATDMTSILASQAKMLTVTRTTICNAAAERKRGPSMVVLKMNFR